MRLAGMGRGLQAVAMAMVLFALGVGLFEGSMSGELIFLFIGIVVFYIGWSLSQRSS